jgi:glycerol-3-phosphate dehydrogenase
VAEPDAPLVNNANYSRREIELLAATEFVTHLSDVVLRRTSLAFKGGLTGALLAELTGILAPILGWDSAAQTSEVAAVVTALREEHSVFVEPAGPVVARVPKNGVAPTATKLTAA